jgi:Ca2+-binding RTX toxin-like protein
VEIAHLLGAAGRQLLGNGRDNGLFGNDGDNRLEGKAGGDKLNGFGGDDILAGGSGSDVLRGGLGDDVLVGGLGDDRLVGGPGADRFVINVLGARDVITDFGASDRIILTAIDADLGEAGNQAFSFIGGAVFTGTAGELRFDGGELQGDVNGDGESDFSVGVTLIDSMILSASDIAL